MTTKRGATLAAGVAATALAAGFVGRALLRRRHEHRVAIESPWELPPEDLGSVASFDGTKIAVMAAGDPSNPMILFVHGFSLDMTTWIEQWRDLSIDFRCVLMDQRSHGRSERAANGDLTLRSMGRDIAAVLDVLSPEHPVMVVGHSMGGMGILALAEQRPELFGSRIGAVVLIGTAPSDLLRGAMGSVTGLLRPRLGTLASAAQRVDRLRKVVLASPADLSGAVARLTQFGPDAPGDVVDHVVGLAQRASSEVWTEGLAELMEMDLRHALARIAIPALVMVGEHDRVTPPAVAVELAATLPKGTLALIEGAGHLPMLERPQQTNLELRRFAGELAGPTASKRRSRRVRNATEETA